MTLYISSAPQVRVRSPYVSPFFPDRRISLSESIASYSSDLRPQHVLFLLRKIYCFSVVESILFQPKTLTVISFGLLVTSFLIRQFSLTIFFVQSTVISVFFNLILERRVRDYLESCADAYQQRAQEALHCIRQLRDHPEIEQIDLETR